MPLSQFPYIFSQIEWLEDIRRTLANECPNYLYAYVFVELYRRGLVLAPQCTAAFLSGSLTIRTFSVEIDGIVHKVVDCGHWSDRERELLRQRFAVAQTETVDFMTEVEGRRPPNDQIQSNYAQYYLERITRDLFGAWMAMAHDMSEILARSYLLEVACTTGYWRFRGLSYLISNGQWQSLAVEPTGPNVTIHQIGTTVSVPHPMVN